MFEESLLLKMILFAAASGVDIAGLGSSFFVYEVLVDYLRFSVFIFS
jgi:hypothetical protein